MAAPSNYAELDTTQLWECIFETMERGFADGVDGLAPAAPFLAARNMLDELVRRDPDWNCLEIAELRDVLDRALAGESGRTGHA